MGLCTKCLSSLPALPLSALCSFSLHEAKTSCWDECVLHKQHWMYFSHCEHILVQSKSTDEVIAAVFHSQLAFKALSGHIVFLLGSCSIYLYIYVAVRHCNATAFKCSWTIIAFQPKNTPNMLMAFQWHRCGPGMFAPGVGTTDRSAGPSPQCRGRGRAAVAPGSAGGMQVLSTAP